MRRTFQMSPYECLTSLSRHTLDGILKNLRQAVLLTEGEDDHLFPVARRAVDARWLKASYEVCGGSILAHKTAKIAKGSGTDLLAIQLYSAHLFVIFASLRDLCVLVPIPSCDGGTSEGDRRWRRAASESPVRSEIGPYQRRHHAPVGRARSLSTVG